MRGSAPDSPQIRLPVGFPDGREPRRASRSWPATGRPGQRAVRHFPPANEGRARLRMVSAPLGSVAEAAGASLLRGRSASHSNNANDAGRHSPEFNRSSRKAENDSFILKFVPSSLVNIRRRRHGNKESAFRCSGNSETAHMFPHYAPPRCRRVVRDGLDSTAFAVEPGRRISHIKLHGPGRLA